MAVWPPLLTTGRPTLGPGVDPRLVGETRRPDGTLQVTYAGSPVYMYYVDLAAGASAGETNGQYLLDFQAHGVWWEVAPQGGPQPGAASIATSALNGTTYVVGTSPSVPPSGPSVVYTFTPSTPGGTCTGACARAWPPVLTSLPPSSTLSGIGTVQRSDGTFQVTYQGQPLYFFANILGKAPATSGLYPLTSLGAVVESPVSTPYGTFTAVTG
jgi:predicted lipoprotein with Yx(FWY)xxD motif